MLGQECWSALRSDDFTFRMVELGISFTVERPTGECSTVVLARVDNAASWVPIVLYDGVVRHPGGSPALAPELAETILARLRAAGQIPHRKGLAIRDEGR